MVFENLAFYLLCFETAYRHIPRLLLEMMFLSCLLKLLFFVSVVG